MLKAAIEPAARAKLHKTSGGVIDTELKELAVSPINLPCAERAVTMLTPVANMPKAMRNSVGANSGGRARSRATGVSMVEIYLNYSKPSRWYQDNL